MAQFSQQFLANLGRPQMSESLFNLGSAVGGLPQKAQDSRIKQEHAQLMQQIQGAEGAQDFTSMKILAQKLALRDPEQAGRVMQAANALEQKQGSRVAVEGMFAEGSTPTPESYMTAAQKALKANDIPLAQTLHGKGLALKKEQDSRSSNKASLLVELKGFSENPKASAAVKQTANQLIAGLKSGSINPSSLDKQMAALRTLTRPVAKGSLSKPDTVEVMEKGPDGKQRNVTKLIIQDPDTGEITYQTVGPTPPKEFAPNRVAESATMMKTENALIEDMEALSVAALKAEALAEGLEKYDPAGGAYGSFKELMKEVMGEQDAVSALRTEASRLSTGAAIQALPKGPASDKDIALVLKGVPPADANAAYFAQYARGIAKMQKAEAAYKREQLNWLSRKRSYQGFTAHMTQKKVQEQFATTDATALKMMEENINDPVYQRSFLKHQGYDYAEYKRQLAEAQDILGGME